MLFFGRYTSMIASERVHRKRINRVAYNAIRPGTERRMSQASPAERKRIVFGSHLIANRALFDRARSTLYKMLIGDL